MKQEDLIPGKVYKVKYTDRFCHVKGDLINEWDFRDRGSISVVFIGQIKLPNFPVDRPDSIGKRNIFHGMSHKDGIFYLMFDCDTIDYIVDDPEEMTLEQVCKELGRNIKIVK